MRLCHALSSLYGCNTCVWALLLTEATKRVPGDKSVTIAEAKDSGIALGVQFLGGKRDICMLTGTDLRTLPALRSSLLGNLSR